MRSRTVIGLAFALLSALTFATSGSLAKGLLESGWSPGAAVTWRVGVASLVLLLPGLLMMRGRWHLMRRGWVSMALFGLLAVAACQLSYFLAVDRISVAVALLLEYLGIILVVGWLWARHGQRPRPLTVVGAAVAVAGLVFVLDVFGAVDVDLIGVLWGLCAAIGLAVYFVVSADDSTGLPPLVLATGGLTIGTLALIAAGLVGIVPMTTATADVQLASLSVPWWAAILLLGIVAAAFSYATGIAATRRLGSKLASFVGLTEVMFAFVWAWVLLGQMPATIQFVGGLLILTGVVLVKIDERPEDVHPGEPTLPETHREPDARPEPIGV
ncbi:DMT family transporter [Ornithinimicrobium ciconiae]|uniref:DMT family transporter n=1 Tax=Ornithinimicrobium ciconiae TaxID=2594265 RepID=A0A516G5Y7_9MICO|nr:DMT family transporter [Ornithinimicrobium ciconiae]QDO86925.1 DMT family transporter [Ornithinimicrobium ciconiae]